MNKLIKVFPSPFELAEELAHELIRMIKEVVKKRTLFSVAISGGNTPKLLFSVLGDHFANSVNWKRVHFFWVDERCVPPDNSESNYGMTKHAFLEKIDISDSNIHRIRGEDDPEKEAIRYSWEIAEFTRKRNGLPLFDVILLGLGEDGHTASIFPGNTELLYTEKICEVTNHPLNLKKRITITGTVINNADNVIFLVTGANKAKILSEIIKKTGFENYPAEHINPVNGVLKWYIDNEASGMIEEFE